MIPERRCLPKPLSRRRRHRSRRSFTLPCGTYEPWREVTSCARSFCLWACLSNHPWLRYRACSETEWISVLGFWRAPLSFPGGLLPGCGFLLFSLSYLCRDWKARCDFISSSYSVLLVPLGRDGTTVVRRDHFFCPWSHGMQLHLAVLYAWFQERGQNLRMCPRTWAVFRLRF